MDDIKKVVIKNDHGKPIFIEDVATVQYGHAPRFGAITGNGEGEKVMGQVMLLKGANTKVVLERVNTRIEEIQSTLPAFKTIIGLVLAKALAALINFLA